MQLSRLPGSRPCQRDRRKGGRHGPERTDHARDRAALRDRLPPGTHHLPSRSRSTQPRHHARVQRDGRTVRPPARHPGGRAAPSNRRHRCRGSAPGAAPADAAAGRKAGSRGAAAPVGGRSRLLRDDRPVPRRGAVGAVRPVRAGRRWHRSGAILDAGRARRDRRLRGHRVRRLRLPHPASAASHRLGPCPTGHRGDRDRGFRDGTPVGRRWHCQLGGRWTIGCRFARGCAGFGVRIPGGIPAARVPSPPLAGRRRVSRRAEAIGHAAELVRRRDVVAVREGCSRRDRQRSGARAAGRAG